MSSHKVTSGCWVDKDMFVTCAQSEVMLWSLKQENPITILDTGSSEPIITVTSKPSSKGRVVIAATSTKVCNVFKLKSDQVKKTVQPTSFLKIVQEHDYYFSVKITSNTSV